MKGFVFNWVAIVIHLQKNKYSACFFVIVCLCITCVFPMPAHAGLSVLDPARKAGLVPHKALYDIRLSGKTSSAHVANIRGKMFYEWAPSCDAWVSKHRFDMTYEYVETPAVRVTSDFATHESFDGKSFNFTVQRKRSGELFEEIRGNATVGEKENLNEAIYSMPEGLVFKLPKGALFPMAHTLAVLEKIKSGDKIYNATLFDGSDTDGPVEINSFTTKPAIYVPPEEGRTANIDQDLIKSKGWNVRLAFFPLNTSDAASDYEMSVVFHENGVISHMNIDYGDFSVTQELRALEPLEGTCSPGTKEEKRQ